MSQTERIFYIIDELAEKGYFKRSEVARHFEVSLKQIQRDKEYLTTRCPLSCGNLDIIFDRSIPAYRLTEESRQRLDKWRTNETLTLAKGKEGGDRFRSSSSLVNRDAEYISYKSYAKENYSPSIYAMILKAMKQNRRIRISYKSSKGESDRVLEPLKLVNYTEIWYMLAAFNGKIQTFSLSRITGAAITDEDISFNDPDELEKVLSGYGIYHDSSEPRIYRIRFYGWAAHIVSAQVWQKDQKIKHIDSDTIELSIPITNDTELLSRILFYGDAADPLEPEDFVLQYREKCSNMAKRYEH